MKVPKDNVIRDLAHTDYSFGFTEDDFRHLQDIKNWLEQKGLLKAKGHHTPY